MSNSKHRVPERTCIACRLIRPRKELVRIVRDSNGNIEIDDNGKMAGRGAYLCSTRECWESVSAKGRKDRLANAFKTSSITQDNRARLAKYGSTLPTAKHVPDRED